MFKNITLKKSKRFLFVISSDTHAGHLLGLLNPNTVFKEWDEKGEQYDLRPQLNKSQQYLWELYTGHIDKVREIAKGCPIIVLHNGDLTIGYKYPNQMAFTAISNQLIAAKYNMYPWFDLPNLAAFRMTYGTQSHELYEGTVPRLVTTSLEEKFPDKDIRLMKHGVTNVGEVDFNYAHHGPYPGSRVWLEGNVARYYLRDLMMRKIMGGKVPPKFVLRAHYHTPIEEKLTIRANGHIHRSYLFITPSYQLMGDYAQQATRSAESVTNGMLVLELEGDRLMYEPEWLIETTDITTKEEILL